MDVSCLLSPHLILLLLSQRLIITSLFNNNIRYLLFTRLHSEPMTGINSFNPLNDPMEMCNLLTKCGQWRGAVGGRQSVCVVVLGEGGGGESLFILFLVSGVPELQEGEASDSDPPRLSAYP